MCNKLASHASIYIDNTHEAVENTVLDTKIKERDKYRGEEKATLLVGFFVNEKAKKDWLISKQGG